MSEIGNGRVHAFGALKLGDGQLFVCGRTDSAEGRKPFVQPSGNDALRKDGLERMRQFVPVLVDEHGQFSNRGGTSGMHARRPGRSTGYATAGAIKTFHFGIYATGQREEGDLFAVNHIEVRGIFRVGCLADIRVRGEVQRSVHRAGVKFEMRRFQVHFDTQVLICF